MKKVFKLMKLFVLVLLLGCSFSFVACNDDENVPQLPDEVTTETMFGNYDGKMFTTIVSPLERMLLPKSTMILFILKVFLSGILFCPSSRMKD